MPVLRDAGAGQDGNKSRPREGKIVMRRKGVDEPAVITGRWTEYALFDNEDGTKSEPDIFWKRKHSFMLTKCLRARGFRELFRDVVGNVYLPEEIRSAPTPGSRQQRDERAQKREAAAAEAGYEISDTIGPRTEPMLKAQLALLGMLSPDIDRAIAEAKEQAEGFDDDEQLYAQIYAKCAQERPQRRPIRPLPQRPQRRAE